MPAVAKPAKADKPAPVNFFDRLAEHGRKDVAAALVQYRALAEELSRDPNYESSVEDTKEILDTLKITAADLAHDAEMLAAIRADESALLTPGQIAAMEIERKELLDTVRKYQEALPHLRGKARSLDTMRAGNYQARGEIDRRKQVHHRLFGDPAEVQRRVEQGLLTGPKVSGQSGQYIPAPGGMVFSATKQ